MKDPLASYSCALEAGFNLRCWFRPWNSHLAVVLVVEGLSMRIVRVDRELSLTLGVLFHHRYVALFPPQRLDVNFWS